MTFADFTVDCNGRWAAELVVFGEETVIERGIFGYGQNRQEAYDNLKTLLPDMDVVMRFCICEDWTLCACGATVAHCMWCCLDLSDERLAQWDFDKDEKFGTPPCICKLVEVEPRSYRLAVDPNCLRHSPKEEQS